ncbi:uncharacterized protein LOC127081447 [Lathyrus oleraceus]|uniref:uncharacterized protein LOC127081447 n=1 Tax=Pisum sativum TaxID=3888 RepID=UPI0021D126D0|nr:uncharacterized protein LOC127081447 [Pisum sativum]
MKELLLGKRKLKDYENISLEKECSAIIQRNLPPKLTDPGRFIIPCSIGSLTISSALCDLEANINLMLLSMMRKLKYGEPKPTHMMLTLADRSIAYPYGILEDVMVKVDDLVFPIYFMILYMPEDSEIPLLLGRPFLGTCKAIIDVEMWELVLNFNNEKFVFNMFEALKAPNVTR